MKIIESITKLKVIKSFHLHRSRPNDWGDAVYWLISTLFMGLAPIWIPLLFLRFFSINTPFKTYTMNGEFALISASILSGSAYIISKENRWDFLKELFNSSNKYNESKGSFPQRRLFTYLANILTVIAVIIYTGALVSKLEIVSLPLDSNLITNLSIFLLGFTMIISFIITVIDNAFYNRPDITELREESADKLEEEFDLLNKEN